MIELTRPGKDVLVVDSPVMPAAGTFGFGDLYKDLIKIEKLGAIVSNPVTYQPWSPSGGTHVVAMDAGILLHTGLPNPGVRKVISKYRGVWEKLPVPLIVHVIANSVADIRRCARLLDQEDSVAGIEIGLSDDTPPSEAAWMVKAAREHSEKPLLARLPLTNIEDMGWAAADAGAGALVVAAPPRGTTRDATGRLIGGRVYGPLVKPIVLRLVGQLVRRIDSEVPIIGAGGIHNQQDARDYIEAGARAVQVDSVTWVQPRMLEIIARDLGGLELTQPTGALLDEWHPGIGETEKKNKEKQKEEETTK